jgi:lysophospholipase L1-like esterase
MNIKGILLALTIICSSCSSASDDDAPVALPSCWFFGDSITEGYGATTPSNRWTSKLCEAKGWKEHNSGVIGETLLKASETTGFGTFFERYEAQIPQKPATGKYVFIAYGANDCGFNFDDYTPALFSTQLQTIIEYANDQGWANSDIVVLTGYFQNDQSWTNPYAGQVLPSAANMSRYDLFITAAQTVAQNNPGVKFVNPFNTYDGNNMSDNLHPNDIGYASIASFVGSQVP